VATADLRTWVRAKYFDERFYVRISDEYTGADEFGNWRRPDSNSYVILSFLAEYPEQGFTPTEIHENVDIPLGSIGPTLQRLEERELVRHRGSYRAITPDDWAVGSLSKQSYIHPRYPTVISESDVATTVGALTETIVDDAVEELGREIGFASSKQ
jgi:hypothetical protein